MSGKGMFRLWLIVGALWAACYAADAAPPWSQLISAHAVDAEPDKAYAVSEDNGPWMIMACSFSGSGAEKQAQDLVYELRKRYKLPSYTYKGRFDPGEAQGRGIDKYGNPLKWKYNKYSNSDDKEKARHPELTEVAVLVGNYQSAEEPEAHNTLQTIKYATPQCLDVKEGKRTNQTLGGWRTIERQLYEAVGSQKKKTGPMGHAFVVPNPHLPPDYFSPGNRVDPLVLEMNKNAEFSLLDCPGKYTVQVATFKGEVIIKQEDIQAVQNGSKEMKSGLAAAADKAHELAQALRMKGYEAYEFHDRYQSIVTVGSFNSLGGRRSDGGVNFNPDILAVVQRFGTDPTTGEKLDPTFQKALEASGVDKPVIGQSLIGIPFDIRPTPIEVPKRSISMAFRGE
jgi:hypothetical protein